MSKIYHSKFFRVGVGKLFKTDSGSVYYKLDTRRYVNNSGVITRVPDWNTREQQYPAIKP